MVLISPFFVVECTSHTSIHDEVGHFCFFTHAPLRERETYPLAKRAPTLSRLFLNVSLCVSCVHKYVSFFFIEYVFFFFNIQFVFSSPVACAVARVSLVLKITLSSTLTCLIYAICNVLFLLKIKCELSNAISNRR